MNKNETGVDASRLSMHLLAKGIVSDVLRLPPTLIIKMPLKLRHKILEYASRKRR